MIKVLVIDDEEIVRKGIVVGTDWNSLGCVVVCDVSNGEEGLEAVEKYNPDLIISDIKMPKMGGIAMLSKLREKKIQTPVIFLTAYSDFSYAQQAIHLSAADYLLKPFEDGQLEEAISRITGKIHCDRKTKSEEQSEDILSEDLIENKGTKSKYVEEAINYIARNYAKPDMGITSIAESLGISDGHLSHVFKNETNYTVNAYITRYRIKAAMKLLKNCHNKIYEVAEMVGYRDITYFSSIFKKVTGMNPSEYQDSTNS